MAQRKPHRAHVGPVGTGALVVRHRRSAAEQRAKGGGEEQRHCERGRQGGNQRDRQVFHELADDAGPEQERRERRDARRGGGDHRARHALGGERIGLPGRHAFGHAALGEFGDDDGVVHQHADGEDEREQNDDVDGETGELQPQHAGEERGRDGDADEQRGAEAEREQDHDGNEQHAGRHRILQVGKHLADELRFVLCEGDMNGLWPSLLQLTHDRFHAVHGLDQIGAGAL